ncbi:hypothetical protein D3C76_1597850 [compost metagenome]
MGHFLLFQRVRHNFLSQIYFGQYDLFRDCYSLDNLFRLLDHKPIIRAQRGQTPIESTANGIKLPFLVISIQLAHDNRCFL